MKTRATERADGMAPEQLESLATFRPDETLRALDGRLIRARERAAMAQAAHLPDDAPTTSTLSTSDLERLAGLDTQGAGLAPEDVSKGVFLLDTAPSPPGSLPSDSTGASGLVPGGGGGPARAPGYVLEKFIAKGGQGEIWSARQSSLQREIAVKIHQNGSVAEFLQEAYVAGELDHPNIIPVHDLDSAAVNGSRRPLIAMKLARGVPWNELIAQDRARPRFNQEAFLARHLDVLASVCHAISYAHSKDIIHRDLKPHQVLVGDYGEVFLVDWGMAMSLREDVPPAAGADFPKFRTRATASNPAGTPAYMAPEQTGRSSEALGKATDVYLLGAILYELVAGRPPHMGESALDSYEKARRNDFPPVPPSAPPQLRSIAEKALSRDPADRHASAADFFKNLRDYLDGSSRRRESREIVEEAAEALKTASGDAKQSYHELIKLELNLNRALQLWTGNLKARKLLGTILVRHAERAFRASDLLLAETLAENLPKADPRRKTLLGRIERARLERAFRDHVRRGAVAGCVALVGALGVLAFLWFGSMGQTAEKERAMDLLKEVALLRFKEDRLARKLESVAPQPASLMADAALDEPAPVEPPLSENAPGDSPENLMALRARLREQRGELAGKLAAHVLEEALENEKEPPALLVAEANLALRQAGNDVQALALAHRLYEAAAAERPELPEPLVGMAAAAARAGDASRAFARLEQASEKAALFYGETHPVRAKILEFQGEAARRLDDKGADYVRYYDQSLKILEPRLAELALTAARRRRALGDARQSLEYSSMALSLIRRLRGEDSLQAAAALASLGKDFKELDRGPESEASLREALAIRLRLRGEEAPETASSYLELGQLLSKQGRVREAREMIEKGAGVLALLEGGAGAKAAEAAMALGTNLLWQGKPEEAEKTQKEALDAMRASLGEGHPDLVPPYNAYAATLLNQDKYQEAYDILRSALEIGEPVLGPKHADMVRTRFLLAQSAWLLKEREEAEEHLEIAMEGARELGEEHGFARALMNSELARQAKYAELERRLDEEVRKTLQEYGEESALSAQYISQQASLQAMLGRFDEAEANMARATAILESIYGRGHLFHSQALFFQANFAVLNGDAKRAGELAREVLATTRLSEDAEDWAQRSAHVVGVCLDMLGRPGEAEPWFALALRLWFELEKSDFVAGFAEPALRWSTVRLARGDLDNAEALAASALDRLSGQPPEDMPDLTQIRRLQAMSILARVWLAQEREAERFGGEKTLAAFRLAALFDQERAANLAWINKLPDGVEPWPRTCAALEAAAAEALLSLDPPREESARRLVLRAAALSRLMGLPFEGSGAELLARWPGDAAALPDPPADFWNESGLATMDDLLAWLDLAAPPVDWRAEFPELDISEEAARQSVPADAEERFARLLEETPSPEEWTSALAADAEPEAQAEDAETGPSG